MPYKTAIDSKYLLFLIGILMCDCGVPVNADSKSIGYKRPVGDAGLSECRCNCMGLSWCKFNVEALCLCWIDLVGSSKIYGRWAAEKV
jgi:hypothetical protein